MREGVFLLDPTAPASLGFPPSLRNKSRITPQQDHYSKGAPMNYISSQLIRVPDFDGRVRPQGILGYRMTGLNVSAFNNVACAYEGPPVE